MLRVFRDARREACAMVAAVVLAMPAAASAQQTRAALLEEEQARKAQQLRPYQPDALERHLLTADATIRLVTHGTVYPFVGSAFDGGGLAVGPGYRGRFGTTGRFDVHAGLSVKNYRVADATLALPAFANERLSILLRASFVDAPDVPFYGTGNDTLRDHRTGFDFRSTTVGVTFRLQATPSLALGAGVDGIDTEAASGLSSSASSISPRYRRTRVFAELDTRESPGYTRRGGLYRAEHAEYHQTNGAAYGFRRTDAEVRQFIPLLRENWVVALRALASSTTASDGQDVPYFLMPNLGGGSWLRGYPSWRFRDRHRLLLSGEYRWMAGRFVDMALFLDAGKVAHRVDDLGEAAFKKSYGIGMSLHTRTSTVARVELARTGEGTAVLLSFGPSF